MKIDPDKIHIGDIILCNTSNGAVLKVQQSLGYGDSSKWTHVAGSLGGLDLVEGTNPVSQISNIQTEYVDKNIPIKVMRKMDWVTDADRIKTALWWASLNNLPYDWPALLWFPFAAVLGRWLLSIHNFFSSKYKLICSELIADGLYKQGYNLFNSTPASDIVPTDFDNPKLFPEITDIYLPQSILRQ